MPVRGYHPPHLVRFAFYKKIDWPGFACIFLYFKQKSFGIHECSECISKRAQMELALGIHKVENLRPAKQIIRSACGRSIRRKEFSEKCDEDKEAKERGANQSQPVLFKLPPH